MKNVLVNKVSFGVLLGKVTVFFDHEFSLSTGERMGSQTCPGAYGLWSYVVYYDVRVSLIDVGYGGDEVGYIPQACFTRR